jgi:hypothetical protein
VAEYDGLEKLLGNGISVFKNNTTKSTLKLLETKTLKSGVVTLHCTTVHLNDGGLDGYVIF